jgi:hypothetical protein
MRGRKREEIRWKRGRYVPSTKVFSHFNSTKTRVNAALIKERKDFPCSHHFLFSSFSPHPPRLPRRGRRSRGCGFGHQMKSSFFCWGGEKGRWRRKNKKGRRTNRGKMKMKKKDREKRKEIEELEEQERKEKKKKKKKKK